MREYLRGLEEKGMLKVVNETTDPRHVQKIIADNNGPILFKNIDGYPEYSICGGIFTNREFMAELLHCSPRNIAQSFQKLSEKTIKPVIVDDAPIRQNRVTGDDVDLASIPIPVMHNLDGGPYFSSGVVIASDPDGEFGTNLGIYRLMYRTRNETGIDLQTAGDLRLFYERALRKNQPLKISVAVGVSPTLVLAASYKAPLGISEYDVAGGILGEGIRVTKSETNGLLVPADTEILLEGELLPIGWTELEGPFGEFAGFQGEIKYNPIFRVQSISYRDNPIYYSLLMPDENHALGLVGTEKLVYNALRNAGLNVHEVYATPGGCSFWHVVASIKKRAGEGKNALLAALSVSGVKLAVITDADVDIFNPKELERAIAFRVQADEDVIIISGARGKHVDPSLKAWTYPVGTLPTTSKMGIDATKPDGIPWDRYTLITCYQEEKAEIVPCSREELKEIIKEKLSHGSVEFTDLMRQLNCYKYKDIIQAWGELREEGVLQREEEGNYYVKC